MHTGQLVKRLINTTNLRHPHSSIHKFTETKQNRAVFRSDHLPSQVRTMMMVVVKMTTTMRNVLMIAHAGCAARAGPLQVWTLSHPAASLLPPASRSWALSPLGPRDPPHPSSHPLPPGCPRTDRTLNLFVRTSEAPGAMCGFCIM